MKSLAALSELQSRFLFMSVNLHYFSTPFISAFHSAVELQGGLGPGYREVNEALLTLCY